MDLKTQTAAPVLHIMLGVILRLINQYQNKAKEFDTSIKLLRAEVPEDLVEIKPRGEDSKEHVAPRLKLMEIYQQVALREAKINEKKKQLEVATAALTKLEEKLQSLGYILTVDPCLHRHQTDRRSPAVVLHLLCSRLDLRIKHKNSLRSCQHPAG